MKYKVALVDPDQIYLARFSKTFGNKYADKLDIFSFSSWQAYENSEEKNRFDMLLVAEGVIDVNTIVEQTPVAVFVEQNDIDTVDGKVAICKYQKHEIIVKQILDFCLEGEEIRFTKKNVLGNTTKVIYVSSATGGTGTTTMAVSLAKNLAQKGKKVLYLSFEKNPATELFLRVPGESSFSDVIYLIKSKKNNLLSRIENIIQRDESGVFFIPPCRTVFDINELSVNELKPLLQELCTVGSYEAIIIDSLIEFNDTGFFLCDYADQILLVANGSKIDSQKLRQLHGAFNIWDKERNSRFISKTHLIYNGYGSKSQQATDIDFKVLGTAPKLDAANELQIVDYITNMNLFELYA